MHPQQEDYRRCVNFNGPRACYDEGKRCAETLFFDYKRQHKTNIKIARIINTYGPRLHQNDGGVVSNFIVHALIERTRVETGKSVTGRVGTGGRRTQKEKK